VIDYARSAVEYSHEYIFIDRLHYSQAGGDGNQFRHRQPPDRCENDAYYYGGNFLGQYVSISMDQLRYYMGLSAKHLDVQIAMIVAPEFNNGLPHSL
jgi:hypothetical protein